MGSMQDRIEVDGAEIARLSWGDPGAPRIVLVHGGAANAHWWSRLAPELAREHHVVALDLSGHGASDHRPEYRFATWAREVLACGPGTVVGHSMGGIVSALAAASGQVERLVLVDTPLLRPDLENDAPLAQVRHYPSREAATSRWRPVPPQPVTDHELVAEIARHSVRETPSGWRFTFDPAGFAGGGPVDRPLDITPVLEGVPCPVTSIVGELSVIVPPEQRTELRRLGGYREIPGGHHHLMLDAPEALAVAVLDAVGAPCYRSLSNGR
jgi:pimeloyl-ACP methyl ester carboxylesterase